MQPRPCLLDFSLFLRKKINLHARIITKFDFQPSAIKPDNASHPTVETGQFGPISGFEGIFYFLELKVFKFKLKKS